MHVPVTGATYLGVVGEGAWRIDADGRTPIATRTPSDSANPIARRTVAAKAPTSATWWSDANVAIVAFPNRARMRSAASAIAGPESRPTGSSSRFASGTSGTCSRTNAS